MQILTVNAHCRDCCAITFPNGKEYDGYVPGDIGLGCGDAVEIEIDIETGRIIGWSDKVRDMILLKQDSKLSRDGELCLEP